MLRIFNTIFAIVLVVACSPASVATLSEENGDIELATYRYNLNNALNGCLADSLMYHYQPFERGLFIPLEGKTPLDAIRASSEVWFQLGEMTLAEHSAMLSLAFFHNEPREDIIRRLAEINLVTGQYEAARKYLNILADSPHNRKWVRQHTPGRFGKATEKWLESKRKDMPRRDFVHGAYDIRPALLSLLEANPDNALAREYLLCYDLLIKDLQSFALDFDPAKSSSRLYEEAMTILFASRGGASAEELDHYRVSRETLSDFEEYNRIYTASGNSMKAVQAAFGTTYWFYYQFAKRNEK
ncbi:MAG: DUF6057 family protein [Bacteroidales bacterium]|nr:DUF6057 family protein [Bacteroidales bacterium]